MPRTGGIVRYVSVVCYASLPFNRYIHTALDHRIFNMQKSLL